MRMNCYLHNLAYISYLKVEFKYSTIQVLASMRVRAKGVTIGDPEA